MSQSGPESYIIRGGEAGRERLRLVSRVMWPTTEALLSRVGIPESATCLDVGCGGGDVTIELQRRAVRGSVVGIDVDAVKVDLARDDARAAGFPDVEFRVEDITRPPAPDDIGRFDVVYVRFVLTHLVDPDAALDHLVARLAPTGTLIVEDLDFRGHFCFPPSASFDRYVELFSEAARLRGADPDIGARLPLMLRSRGLDTRMNVVQPAGFDGEVKLMAHVTLEAIADNLVAAGLATEAEVADMVADLARFADRGDTVMSVPRIVQAWGRRSGEVA